MQKMNLYGNLKFLSKVMDSIDDIVFITDENFDIIYANNAFEKITGFSDYIGKNPNIMESDKSKIEDYKELWNNLKENKPFNMIVTNRKKNGEEFIMEQEMGVFIDEESSKRFYISIGRDITKEEAAKKQMEKEAHNFKILFDEFYECLFRLDKEFKILEINKSALNNVSEEKGYFEGRFLFEFLDKMKLSYVKDEIIKMSDGEELKMKSKNGMTYSIRVIFLKDGQKLLELKDISDVIRDEEFLRSTNDILKFQIERKDEEINLEKKKLFNFLNTLNIPIVKLNSDFEVNFVNNFSRQVFALAEDDCVEMMNKIIAGDIMLFKETAEKHKNESISFDSSYEINNKEFYILWTLMSTDGKDSDYLLIGDDISNIKELIKKQEELVVLLQNRTKNIECLYTVSEIGRKNLGIYDIVENTIAYINDVWGGNSDIFLKAQIFNNIHPETYYGKEEKDPIYSFPINVNDMTEGGLYVYSDNPMFKSDEYRNLFKSVSLIIENSISNRIYEERLLEKQNKLLELQQIAKLGTWEYDIETNKLEISEETRKILEIPDLQKEFTIMNFIKKLSNEDSKKMMKLFEEIKTKVFEDKISVKYFTKENKEVNLFIHIKSNDDISGRRKVLGTIYEITDLVKIQKELEEAKIEAINSNKAKSLFLANMSHEIRTPLNAILGFAQILMNKRDISEENKNQISIIHRSGEHLLSLINDILDISKVEAGKMEVKNEKFNLHLILKDIKNMFAGSATKNNLEFVVNYKENLPRYLMGDSKKIKQVIVNLLGNSFKFTDEGSIHLNVHHEELGEKRCRIYFHIRDTGVGISEEDLHKIFDKFYQAGNARTGTGLGLTITKNIIDMLGGEIKVQSELYKGTDFFISFDMDRCDEVLEEEENKFVFSKNINVEENYNHKILVVDDVMENISLLKSILGEIGIDVYTANNASEALLLFERLNFDMVFMDIKLPDLDGREVIKNMRASEREKEPFIVGISASTFEDDIQSVISAGADDFISKPFSLEKIYEILGNYLPIKVYETNEESYEVEVQKAFSILSNEMQNKFFEVIDEGDFFGISDLIEKIDDEYSDFKDKCRKILDKFDYEELKNFILMNTKK